ncbi:MAG: hypothetical protein B7Y39_12330 [Bdellovibrio sp. 28-41-41]|nr:MAG: hypothetical protein B7Y39_12330 [Bdellovibrio sp. 28-41-41]
MYFNHRATHLALTLTICLSASFSAKAQSSSTLSVSPNVSAPKEEEEKPYKPTGKVLFSVYSRQTEDEFSRSHQGVTVINPEFSARYGEYITLGLDLAGFFGTGNASNFWTDDGKAPNSIVLSEAYAKINIHPNLFVKAGAIKTPLNPLMSIMTPGAFMGTQEEWQIGADESNITVNAFQAIPSSGTVTKRIYDDGTQAYFLSQTVSGKLKAQTGTEVKLAATRFQFENLSTNVATDSYFLGNSLTAFEGSSKSFRFRHGFMGTESGVTVKQEIGKHELFLFASTIVNDQAEAGKNKGNMVGGSVKTVFGNYIVRPSYTRFNYDADVTPTVYTTMTGRFQNRDGYRVGIDIELKKERLALKNYYIKMDLKDANPYLADREIYNIAVEAKYDIF